MAANTLEGKKTAEKNSVKIDPNWGTKKVEIMEEICLKKLAKKALKKSQRKKASKQKK
ncbi:MAG: hypothetical protein U5L76_03665 [Patescibacteria group bacterium]|nr:hypothetical protein [Patescibacteria group bacterium]